MQQYKEIRASSEVLTSSGEWRDDAEIAKAVREVSCRFVATIEPLERVTLHRISREIPRLRQLRYQEHRAPLTMQAVKEVTETPEDFAIRFIQWLVKKHQEGNIHLTRGGLRRRIMKLGRSFHLPAVQQALEEAAIQLTEDA